MARASRPPGGKRGGSLARHYRPTEERRTEIVEAAIAIIAEQGLRDLKTAALARRMGLSEAAIFRHFGSMEEILVAAVQHEAGLIRDRLAKFEGSGTAWDRAEQLVLSLLEFFEETGGGPLVIVTGQVVRVSDEVRAPVTRTLSAIRQRLLELTTEVVEGSTETIPADRLADLLIAVVQSNGLRWVMSERRWPMKQSAVGMLAILRRAVGAPGAATSNS